MERPISGVGRGVASRRGEVARTGRLIDLLFIVDFLGEVKCTVFIAKADGTSE
jgi:hypothetical protein